MNVFAWSDFLAVAEWLSAGRPTEVDRRSTISRSYYAAYHAAAAFVRARGILTRGHSHQRVWGALTGDADPVRADLGIRGGRLRLLRLEADYRNPYRGDLGEEARFALVESQAVVDAIARLS